MTDNVTPIDERAELLTELGITAEMQSRFDRLAGQLRTVRAELEEAYQAAEPDTDTEGRCAQALEELDGVLYHLEWKAPGADGEPLS